MSGVDRVITLPKQTEKPQSIEEQIYAAVYSASVYNFVTKIEHGHQIVYVVPAHVYEKWKATLNA